MDDFGTLIFKLRFFSYFYRSFISILISILISFHFIPFCLLGLNTSPSLLLLLFPLQKETFIILFLQPTLLTTIAKVEGVRADTSKGKLV
ncbi:hypothetical protein EYC80_004025 [Monilinia laxa]|uniref:Uncharacterized protein n=1 Tax=Monilinia laxa TaxID=61186 RepID=A0A5N6KLM3_MONLA|nr:hypothetical protein EYC80_004025 [Monilinia laxa]